MKKLIVLEMAVLSVLLVIAVMLSTKPNKPTLSQNQLSTTTSSSDTTTNAADTHQTEAAQNGPTWNTYPEDRQITAQQYFVYDYQDRAYLLNSGSADDRVYPASFTKLFTAYVIMYYLQPDNYCTVGDEIDLVAPGSSLAQLQKGDRLTARQLIEGMLLSGGNDAAYVLACNSGRIITGKPQLDAASAVQAFVQEMNRRAKTLGMPNTHFVNPDGIHDPDQYSTIKDLTTLTTLCMSNNTIMRNVIVPEADITLHGETVVWKNTNALIDPESPYYCPYAIGLNTDQTPEAGKNLLSIFKKDGRFLIIGVFGSRSHADCFDDALQLFNQFVLD